MALISENNRLLGLVGSLGREALNALYPNEFEAYMLAIELTDSLGNSIDYMAFPIMPESIAKTEPKRINVKKSLAGISVINSNSPVPAEISIKGDFGRFFQFVVSPNNSISGFAFSVSAGKRTLVDINSETATLTGNTFSVGFKTGYGAIKMLQAILAKSNGLDNIGRPFNLYLYNMAFGESYRVVVAPAGPTFSQSLDKNMIWRYSVSFIVLADLKDISGQRGQTSLSRLLSPANIQKAINNSAKFVKGSL